MFVKRLIQNADAKKESRPSALIFLEEWMTSDKIRPTLSHLLQLLIKCELYRAAEYVAINLLGGKTTKIYFIYHLESSSASFCHLCRSSTPTTEQWSSGKN